ncbi:MAG: C25 family cysteine peptidase [Caldilineaceae bacterium]
MRRPSAEAIRDFLRYACASWPKPAPHPRVAGGRRHPDPRLSGRQRADHIPPFLASVDPDLGETAADNRYAAIVGDDVTPDLYVGRFPAATPADVTAMVNKTIAYEAAQRQGRLAAAHPLRHRQPGGGRRRLLQLLRFGGRRHGGDAGGRAAVGAGDIQQGAALPGLDLSRRGSRRPAATRSSAP